MRRGWPRSSNRRRVHDDGIVGQISEADPSSLEAPGLHARYQAAASGVAVSAERAGQPVLRLLVQSPKEPDSPSDPGADTPAAKALGVNLYAKQLVDGRDRRQLERLCRYVMRPPLSQERLERRSDGRLQLTLKNVWKHGLAPWPPPERRAGVLFEQLALTFG